MRLVWRVFLANAAVISAAALILALTPATISSPIASTQAVALGLGTAVLLLVDLWLLRRAFKPFGRLVEFMRQVDPLRPGSRFTGSASDPDVRAVADGIHDMLDRLELERRESGRRQLLAQETERRRVARDLHDEVGQLLTATLLQLDQARATAGDIAPLLEAQKATEAALEEVRAISQRLRPLTLDDLGLADALIALCSAIGRQAQIGVRWEIRPEDVADLTPEEEVVIYRVAQESLTNAVRHAEAKTIRLALASDDTFVELSVRDDGVGAVLLREGSGIRGMRERALLVAGTLAVTGGAGGTEVRLRLPIAARMGR